jgi:hypothetical protein
MHEQFFLNKITYKKNNNGPVSNEKFETLCKELENALLREQQAESLLHQQSSQLEELSSKLAEFSMNELESFKLKESCNQTVNNIQKKDKIIKTMQKKISNLQHLKENYENSACSILL